jgi:alkaline phosphatase D
MPTRRLFLTGATVSTLLPSAVIHAQVQKNPFTLGVASGSPRDTSVVLWTRLAPEPLKGGGMPVGAVPVRYRVCADAAMKKTVFEGTVYTSDAKAHAVHVLQRGLQPGREYWYQFYFAGAESPVGRTRTTSPKDKTARFALASCNSYEAGYFSAYADMAAWAPDCVIHVGDYIYEGGSNPIGPRTVKAGADDVTIQGVRQHNSGEIISLWQYRNRYALYKSDPHLQAAHAASPWIMAMDDHEIDNNWAADIPEDPWAQTPLEFQVRKLAALQAYYEHTPLEEPPVLNGLNAHLQMYGAYRFGPAQVYMLDTRQYRSDQVCEDEFPGSNMCDALADPTRTMTGREQEQWLVHALKASGASYNVIASQTWFAPYRYNPQPEGPKVNMDQWDGYPLQRQRLTDVLADGVANPVVLGGDWHCASAMRIHQDPWDTATKRVGHNFNGTSISSHCTWWKQLNAAKAYNPHVDYVNGAQRGYLRCDVRPDNFIAQFRTVTDPTSPQSTVLTDTEIRTRDV